MRTQKSARVELNSSSEPLWCSRVWLPLLGLAALLLIGIVYLVPRIETQLLAPLALLFFCATGLGLLVGDGWCRRRFTDVSERYEALLTVREEEDDLWSRVLDRLDPKDSAIEPRLRSIAADLPPATPDLHSGRRHVDKQSERAGPTPSWDPEPTLLSDLDRPLAELRAQIAALQISAQADLSPVEESLRQLDLNVAAVTPPESLQELAGEAALASSGDDPPKHCPDRGLAPLLNSLADLTDPLASRRHRPPRPTPDPDR